MPKQPPAAINYCWNCGDSLRPDAKYCQYCGKMVSQSGVTPDYIARMVEFGPSVGLMLSSIIQAACMGYLFIVSRGQINNLTASASSQIYAIFIVGSFLVIVIIWNECVIAMQSFGFPQNFWMMTLPFFMGLAQFLMIMSIDLQNVAWWYLSLGLTTLLGFFMFVTVDHQARLFPEQNRAVLERIGGSSLPALVMLSCASTFFCFGVLESIWRLNSLYIAIGALIILTGFLMREAFYWKKFF